MFVPATISEYLGARLNFAEVIDLGGACAAGMVWRAAAAIELGVADVVVCALPSMPAPQPPASPAVAADQVVAVKSAPPPHVHGKGRGRAHKH